MAEILIELISVAEDVKYVRYPNLSKNTIKIKRSSILLSLFVSTISSSFLLLFESSNRLNCRSSYWWCDVNSRKSRGRLVKMILVEQSDELPEVLDR